MPVFVLFLEVLVEYQFELLRQFGESRALSSAELKRSWWSGPSCGRMGVSGDSLRNAGTGAHNLKVSQFPYSRPQRGDHEFRGP
jgi:hypothetical protein